MHDVLSATARFSGVTRSMSPTSSTICNATATVTQLVQLASAHASLAWSAEPEATSASMNAKSYCTEPSTSFMTTAWLSFGPGRGGNSNQCGTRTSASAAAVSRPGVLAPASGTATEVERVRAAVTPVATATGSPTATPCTARTASSTVPRSDASTGWYWPFGHQATAANARRPPATKVAVPRSTGRPSVASQTRRPVRVPSRVRRKAVLAMGIAMAMTASIPAPTPASSPPRQLSVAALNWRPRLSHPVARMRGVDTTITSRENSSTGTTTMTQTVTTTRAHGRRTFDSGRPHRHGRSPRSVGLMRANKSGTPVTSARMW